jgi:orotate phosphoribosyltransferase
MSSIARVAVPAPEAQALLESAGALMKGHFLLSSGLHSPEYFQCAKLLETPAVAEEIARKMAPLCAEWGVQTVLSPALGAILFGYELSRALGCRNIFAERPAGAFELRRGFSLAAGERVLLAENVITTGGSVEEVARLAAGMGAEIVGYAVIVDRSSGRFAPREPLIAYAAADAITHEASSCPQCAEGSPVEKPGSRNIKS